MIKLIQPRTIWLTTCLSAGLVLAWAHAYATPTCQSQPVPENCSTRHRIGYGCSTIPGSGGGCCMYHLMQCDVTLATYYVRWLYPGEDCTDWDPGPGTLFFCPSYDPMDAPI